MNEVEELLQYDKKAIMRLIIQGIRRPANCAAIALLHLKKYNNPSDAATVREILNNGSAIAHLNAAT